MGDVGDLAVGDSRSNPSFFHRGRQVAASTPLAGLVDDSGNVVKLVLVSYTGSRAKKRQRRRGEANTTDSLSDSPNAIYSLAEPGLDDGWEGIGRVGETVRRGRAGGARAGGARAGGARAGGARAGGARAVAVADASRLPSPTADELIGKLRSKYRDRIHHEVKMERRAGRVTDFEGAGVPDVLAGYLKEAGIDSLWRHQVEAWHARSSSFVVTTSTASGKTVCYLLPL
ncbi:MAG: hypothetical protein ABGY24_08705, partial [bacterium]